MKNARLYLGSITGLALVGAIVAFKVQNKFVGHYFCAGTYKGDWFDYVYTTANPTVTLYCTLVASLPKTKTFKVAANF